MNKMFCTGLCLAATFLSCSGPISADDIDRSAWELKTQEDAAARAAIYFPESKMTVTDMSESAELVLFENDNTPFLRESLNNRHGWCIDVETTLDLEHWRPSDSVDDKVRTFTASLDAETGLLARVSYVLAEDYPHKTPTLSADSAETVLRAAGEIFYGFPAELPGVSFVEALNYVVGNPFNAKEIQGWYVMYSRHGVQPHPVWVIDLRGVDPPFESMFRAGRESNIPIEKRNHMRSVIDARTGAHITSANFPVW